MPSHFLLSYGPWQPAENLFCPSPGCRMRNVCSALCCLLMLSVSEQVGPSGVLSLETHCYGLDVACVLLHPQPHPALMG